jgi:hypothetical protein
MDAGSVFGEAGVAFDSTQVIPAPLEYQVIPITLDGPAPPAALAAAPASFAMDNAQLELFARSGAAARAPVRRVGRARFRNDRVEPAATFAPPRWTIVPVGEGPAASVDPGVKTYVEYQAVVTAMNRASARWQVVPTNELEGGKTDAG